MEGFNIRFKFNNKTLLGCTQDDLAIAAVTKESITKADQGKTNEKVVRHDVTFSMSAIYSLNADSSTTELDRDDLIAMALQEGDSAKFPFEYGPAGGDIYQGTAIITNYTESSAASADEDATISLNCKAIGGVTKKS